MKKSQLRPYFGTYSNLAKQLKISSAAISRWPETIPEARALKIEKLTNGALAYDPACYEEKANPRE